MVDDDVADIPMITVITGPARIGLCDTLELHALFTSGILGGRPINYEWKLPDGFVTNTTNCAIDKTKPLLVIKPSCFAQNPTNETWKLFTFQLTATRTLKPAQSSKYFIVNRTCMLLFANLYSNKTPFILCGFQQLFCQ